MKKRKQETPEWACTSGPDFKALRLKNKIKISLMAILSGYPESLIKSFERGSWEGLNSFSYHIIVSALLDELDRRKYELERQNDGYGWDW